METQGKCFLTKPLRAPVVTKHSALPQNATHLQPHSQPHTPRLHADSHTPGCSFHLQICFPLPSPAAREVHTLKHPLPRVVHGACSRAAFQHLLPANKGKFPVPLCRGKEEALLISQESYSEVHVEKLQLLWVLGYLALLAVKYVIHLWFDRHCIDNFSLLYIREEVLLAKKKLIFPESHPSSFFNETQSFCVLITTCWIQTS